MKSVECLLPCNNTETIHKVLDFQVGDLVTRGLLAVSQLCSLGAGVWFGPGPEFKSYIVWDREAFIAAAGPKPEINMKNGTYVLPIREVYKSRSDGSPLNDVEGERAEGEQSPSAGQGPASSSSDPVHVDPGVQGKSGEPGGQLGDRDLVDPSVENVPQEIDNT